MNKINFFKVAVAFAAGCFTAWALFAPTLEKEEVDHHHHEHEGEEVAFNEEQLQEHQIAVGQVKKGTISSSVELRGRAQFHPDLVVHVLPKMAGVVVEARKGMGDRVKKGEVLAWMESQEMAQAKAEFLKAVQNEPLEKARFERNAQLFEKRLSSESELQSAQAEYEKAKIDRILAKERLLAFGLSQEDLQKLTSGEESDFRLYALRSPLDGVILHSHLSAGEFVEGTQEAFEIVDPSTVRIELTLPMEELSRVKPGDAITIRSPCNGSEYSAHISYVTSHLKPDTLSGAAYADISSPGVSVCPGMYLSVTATKPLKENVLRVPNGALQEMEGQSVVFVRDGDLFHPREVRLGVKDRDYSEVLLGVNEGETIATSGAFLIKADLGKHTLEHED